MKQFAMLLRHVGIHSDCVDCYSELPMVRLCELALVNAGLLTRACITEDVAVGKRFARAIRDARCSVVDGASCARHYCRMLLSCPRSVRPLALRTGGRVARLLLAVSQWSFLASAPAVRRSSARCFHLPLAARFPPMRTWSSCLSRVGARA